jgi:hypothetical protein
MNTYIPAGYISFAVAIDRVGRNRFSDWTGRETASTRSDWDPIPTFEAHYHGGTLLTSTGFQEMDPHSARELWKVEQPKLIASRQTRTAARSRFEEIRNWFRGALDAGQLTALFHCFDSGALLPIDQSHWRSIKAEEDLERGRRVFRGKHGQFLLPEITIVNRAHPARTPAGPPEANQPATAMDTNIPAPQVSLETPVGTVLLGDNPAVPAHGVSEQPVSQGGAPPVEAGSDVRQQNRVAMDAVGAPASGKRVARKVGRPPGVGSIDDSDNLRQMAALIQSDPTMTAQAAATRVGETQSAMSRLAKKFRKEARGGKFPGGR